MRIRNIVFAAAAAVALTVAPVSAASAVAPKTVAASGDNALTVGGGTWQYGTTSASVYSNYHHPTKSHTATACDGSIFQGCTQAVAVKGNWARASRTKTFIGGNTAFWNTI